MNKLDKIEQLVNWQFPTLRAAMAAGPMGKSSQEHRATLKARADAYRAELFALSPDDLIAFFQNAVEIRAKRAEIAALREDETLFFSQHNAIADYEYWTKAEYWTLDEAIVLALGKDPTVVTPANLAPFGLTSPFVKRFRRLQNLALRAKATGKLSDPVLPFIFVKWTMDKAIDIPELMREPIISKIERPDWESVCAKQSEAIKFLESHLAASLAENETLRSSLAELQAREPEIVTATGAPLKKQAPTERENMLVVIWAMALDGYGHKPENKRTETVREIKDAVEKLGLSLSDDTIRRYLTTAASLIPEVIERRS